MRGAIEQGNLNLKKLPDPFAIARGFDTLFYLRFTIHDLLSGS